MHWPVLRVFLLSKLHRLRAARAIATISAATFLTCSGCRHTSAPGSMALPPAPLPAINIHDPRPPQSLAPLDLSWLELDDFLPPGAQRVGPESPLRFALLETPGESYPSSQICPAPHGRAYLSCESMQQNSTITHWLMLNDPASTVPTYLFQTIRAFDVLWSADARHVAVSHAIGENRSDVLLLALRTGSRSNPIDVTPTLENYFPDHYRTAHLFVKAYRWTTAGLVIRGIGRAASAPRGEFGFELLLDPDANLPERRTTFLRGFIKPAAR